MITKIETKKNVSISNFMRNKPSLWQLSPITLYSREQSKRFVKNETNKLISKGLQVARLSRIIVNHILEYTPPMTYAIEEGYRV